jgi:hypothetical protein
LSNFWLLGWTGGLTALIFCIAAEHALQRPIDFLPMVALSGLLLLAIARAFVPQSNR